MTENAMPLPYDVQSIVPEEDAWIYSLAWQEKLRQAEADISAGRTRSFADDAELLAHLGSFTAEARR